VKINNGSEIILISSPRVFIKKGVLVFPDAANELPAAAAIKFPMMRNSA
jgi:hypothetical protein